jgi:hypothetical protein
MTRIFKLLAIGMTLWTTSISPARAETLAQHLAAEIPRTDAIFGGPGKTAATWIEYRVLQGRIDGIIELLPYTIAAVRSVAATNDGEIRTKAGEYATTLEARLKSSSAIQSSVNRSFTAFKALPLPLDHVAGDEAYFTERAKYIAAIPNSWNDHDTLLSKPFTDMERNVLEGWSAGMEYFLAVAAKHQTDATQ